MLNIRLFLRTARNSSRGGFTLVELLVVIAIIAILASVMIGPIASSIKKAQISQALQGTKGMALAEFQYSTDNSNNYPAATTLGAMVSLMYPNYISDIGSLIINGSGHTKTPTPQTAASIISAKDSTATCDYDFVTGTGNIAITASYPDGTPIVFSGATAPMSIAAGASPSSTVSNMTVDSTCPLGIAGMVVCYKSTSAKFIAAPTTSPFTVPVVDIGYPAGYGMVSFGSW